jgi:hypothetical protein
MGLYPIGAVVPFLYQIPRDIAFDLLKDVDGLPLITEAWQYLDEATQECVTRHEEKKEKQNGRKEPAGKIPGAGEKLRHKR